MDNHSNVLVAAGSLCLTITLVLAWCLAGVRASGFMKRLIRGAGRTTGSVMALAEYSRSATDPASVRNTLALVSSKDLRVWRLERVVASNPDPVRHAFQYADWQFDGPDIAAVARTAFDDEDGGRRAATMQITSPSTGSLTSGRDPYSETMPVC